jgi:hypothetical protein
MSSSSRSPLDSDGNRWDDPRAHPVLHLLSTPSITRTEVGQFVDAMCRLYDVGPWQRMSNRHCLAVKVGSRQERPKFVVAMGRAGIETGLAIYDRFRDFVNMFRPYAPREARVPEHGTLGMRFKPLTTLPLDDGRLFMECRFAHRDQRYPNLLRYFASREESPTLEDLRWVEAAAAAIEVFYTRKLADDEEGDFIPVEADIDVTTRIGGERKVTVYVRYPGGEVPKSQTVLVDMVETLERAAKEGQFRSGCAAHQDFYKVMQDNEKAAEDSVAAADRACASCGSGPEAPFQCSRCKEVRYCDAACQRADFPLHKGECRRLRVAAEAREKARARAERDRQNALDHGHSHSHSHGHGHGHDHGHEHGH